MEALCRGLLAARNVPDEMKPALLERVLSAAALLPNEVAGLLALAAALPPHFARCARPIAEAIAKAPQLPTISPETCGASQRALRKLLLDSPPDIRESLCLLIARLPIECFPADSQPSVETLVLWANDAQPGTLGPNYDARAFAVSAGLARVVGGSQQALWWALCKCFELLSAVPADERHWRPSPALASVLLLTPPSDVERVAGFVTARTVDPSLLLLAVQRLFAWPLLQPLFRWALALLRGLAASRQLSVLAKATASCVQLLLPQMVLPELRSGAFALLEFMLLGFQHNPVVFHSIAPKIPALLNRIASAAAPDSAALPIQDHTFLPFSLLSELESEQSVVLATSEPLEAHSLGRLDEDFAVRISTLLQCLVFRFPGHPEIYGPLLPILSLRPLPELRVAEILKANAWVLASDFDSSGLESAAVSACGRVGLVNIGSSCFANATLQAINSSDEFRSFLFSMPLLHRPAVLPHLQRTLAFLALSQRAAFVPKHLLFAMPKTWHGLTQQDASEFLRSLLDIVEIELKSEMHSAPKFPCSGSFVSTIECSGCRRQNSSTEPFIDITLALGEHAQTVEELLESFLQPTILSGENQYHCTGCGSLSDAVKSTQVRFPPPPVLVITLGRFRFNNTTGRSEKVLTAVPLQELLSLRCALEDGSPFRAEYNLTAVVMHSGRTLEFGHYYTVAKSSCSDWVLHNDSNTSLFPFSQLSSVTSSFPLDVPYILFFSRSDCSQVAVSIPDELKRQVFTDNALLLLELEHGAQQRQQRQPESIPSHRRYDDQDDEDDHSSSSFDQGIPRMVC